MPREDPWRQQASSSQRWAPQQPYSEEEQEISDHGTLSSMDRGEEEEPEEFRIYGQSSSVMAESQDWSMEQPARERRSERRRVPSPHTPPNPEEQPEPRQESRRSRQRRPPQAATPRSSTPNRSPVRTNPREETYPTEREAQRIAARPGASSRAQHARLTGAQAPFPLLGFRRSRDPVLNMAWELHARLVVHKWKQLVWMLRVRLVFERSRIEWRRPPRWLSSMLAREVGSMWGQLGAARQYVASDKGPPLMR